MLETFVKLSFLIRFDAKECQLRKNHLFSPSPSSSLPEDSKDIQDPPMEGFYADEKERFSNTDLDAKYRDFKSVWSERYFVISLM